MPEFNEDEAEIVYISGKQAEEIGFEKFSRRQAKLQGIRVLVLDRMRIQHRFPDGHNDRGREIRELCAEITDLDLSGNLFESFGEIAGLCRLLPKLRVLTLDGNRFATDEGKDVPILQTVKSLSLSRTLLQPAEVSRIVSCFPSLETLSLAYDEYSDPIRLELPKTLRTLNLSDNHFTSLSQLGHLGISCPNLHTLILKRNRISTIRTNTGTDFSLPIQELDLSYNAIDTWTFFVDMPTPAFPELNHLRVTGNPLYKNLTSADDKPLTAEDGYMLTMARLRQLEYLNYARITEKERLNAETYYLGQIAIELSRPSESKVAEVIAHHLRYRELCDEYGEPTIQRKPKVDELDPNSLAARLVGITFTLAANGFSDANERSWIEEVPKSFNVYSVFGLVGKRLGVMPLDLRLVSETSERDPMARDSGYSGPEWWDSSDDEAEGEKREGEGWVKREVELVAGTRALGTYVDGRDASVRVEMRDGDD